MQTETSDDLLSPELNANPYAYFARLRAQAPVSWNHRHRAWLVTRYDDVRAGLSDPRLSSDTITPFFERRVPVEDQPRLAHAFDILRTWAVFQRPPDHTRIRRVVMGSFTPSRVRRLTDYSRALARTTLAATIANAAPAGEGLIRVDVQGDYAHHLPGTTILELLGLPQQDRPAFRGWAEDLGALINGVVSDEDRISRAADAVAAMEDYLTWLITHETGSDDGLIQALVATEGSEDGLSRQEVIGTCILLLDAGFKNTVRLISNAALVLLAHPDQLQQVRAEADLLEPAIEEVLRYEGPGKLLVRIAAQDLVLCDQEISEGDRIFLVQASANRDATQFDDPDRFDVHRQPVGHLTFGHGPHFCLGAALARMQGAVALEALLPLLDDRAQLLDDTPSWQPALLSRNVDQLNVVLAADHRHSTSP